MTLTQIANNIFIGDKPSKENLNTLKKQSIKLLVNLFPDRKTESDNSNTNGESIEKHVFTIEDYDMNILKIEVPEKVLDTYCGNGTLLVDIVKIIYIESLKVPIYIYSTDNSLDVLISALIYAFINNTNINETMLEVKKLKLIEKTYKYDSDETKIGVDEIIDGVKLIIGNHLEPFDFYRAPHPFSNFSKHKVFSSKFQKEFPYSEAAFMAYKSPENPEYVEGLTQVNSPGVAKSMGRKVNLRKDWEQVKYDCMIETLRDKVKSNPPIKADIEETGIKPIYEHTKNDKIWGDNLDRTGRNLLGKAWNQIRLEYTAGLL